MCLSEMLQTMQIYYLHPFLFYGNHMYSSQDSIIATSPAIR